MKYTYKHTVLTCYLAYITSAVINNLAPLLFVTFSKEFGLSLEDISLIITMNFAIQIIVDFLGAKFTDKIGYRNIIITAQLFAALGFIGLGTFPKIFPNPYTGILLSAFLYAVGSGLTEVVISPIVEAVPGDAKTSSMSLLHSFYCWGHVFTVIVSTLFLKVFGTENWGILCYLWAILPVITMFLFFKVPINQLAAKDGDRTKLRSVFGVKILWIFMLLMICSGAAEQSMAQWVSFFAETELHVSKQVADLLGPCLFAITMGISRVLYSIIGEKVDMKISLFLMSVLCIISYLLAAFSPHPLICLAGCALTGFSVGIFWPGVLSLASKTYPLGGTAMFAILALFGDVGCFTGPETVARASSVISETARVKDGLAFASVFPAVLAIGVIALAVISKFKKNNK